MNAIIQGRYIWGWSISHGRSVGVVTSRSTQNVFFIQSAVAFAVAACGGTQLRGNTFEKPGMSYEIGEIPATWERVEVEGSDLTWSHAGSGALIQVNGSCKAGNDIPLRSLTQHLLIGFTERNVISEQRKPLASREALHTELDAKLDGVERRLWLVVMKKNNCAYDFALVSPRGGAFAQAKPDFSRMLGGFRDLSQEEAP